ncbi:hypothetical protein [Terasakiella pusilla]|uniref:hypothetical protein n=1 Tax=Terasakiella pusilla TaxID=64973 RepID=UPI003AA93418
MKKVAPLALAGLLFGLSGCMTTYPLGFSENEWLALTPQQQLDARQEQARLDADKRREEQARKEREAEAQRHYQANIQKRYQTAQYGDVVQCILKNTVVDFKPGWRDAEPVAFNLVKGEQKAIELHSRPSGKKTDVWVTLDEQGLNLSLCRNQSSSRRGTCATIVATTQQFSQGYTTQMQVSDYLRTNIYCSLAPTRDLNRILLLNTND